MSVLYLGSFALVSFSLASLLRNLQIYFYLLLRSLRDLPLAPPTRLFFAPSLRYDTAQSTYLTYLTVLYMQLLAWMELLPRSGKMTRCFCLSGIVLPANRCSTPDDGYLVCARILGRR